jgi:peptidoglycan/xylan/chitin deacetylase (PgdA/CDA1 family)
MWPILTKDNDGGEYAYPVRSLLLALTLATAGSQPVLHLPNVLPARTVELPILTYHRVDFLRPSLPPITRRLTVDPGDFAVQMHWLKRSGFHTVTQREVFDALELGRPLPRKPVLLTFDDGYRDILGKASPVLARLGLHATAYVITSRISGSDTSFLTWPQLALLERRGIEIGSHTVHHLELPGLSDAAAFHELVASRRALEQHLHHPVQWFSYPAGAFDARSVALVRRAGYVLAVTTRPGSLQEARHPLELHRYEVLDSTGVAGLAAILK